jgi:predicted DNA binding CopG/RHH family protein
MSAKERPSTSEVRKPIPSFVDEAEERAFWERADSSEYLDWRPAKPVRSPNLQASKTAISLRLPVGLLEQIKIAANKRDAPYQSLIKMWLSEKAGSQWRKGAAA